MGAMGYSVVGIGGSLSAGSQSEAILRAALSASHEAGGLTQAFVGADLDLPSYYPGREIPAAAQLLVDAVRTADALIISSPGYHGTISGMVKNALDYLEELAGDERVYLTGRPIGLIAVARGHQAAVGTLSTLRLVSHSLRAWPTPLGIAVNSAVTRFDPAAPDPHLAGQLATMAGELAGFVTGRADGRTDAG